MVVTSTSVLIPAAFAAPSRAMQRARAVSLSKDSGQTRRTSGEQIIRCSCGKTKPSRSTSTSPAVVGTLLTSLPRRGGVGGSCGLSLRHHITTQSQTDQQALTPRSGRVRRSRQSEFFSEEKQTFTAGVHSRGEERAPPYGGKVNACAERGMAAGGWGAHAK